MFGERTHVRVNPDARVTGDAISSRLAAEGLTVESIRPVATSLEDVFIKRLAN